MINRSLTLLCTFIALCLPGREAHCADEKNSQPVTLTEDGDAYTLANGIVTAKISKHDGTLRSLVYKGMETVNTGFWSHNPGGNQLTDTITISPGSNGGELGEVAIKGISGGLPMGKGPGGSTIADVEVRYALGRGVSGLYTYSIFTHEAAYPATGVGEARFCAKLNDSIFDWMTVDKLRNMKMITTYDWNHGVVMNMKEARRMTSGLYNGEVEHKYDYSANQFETKVWGWSSTGKNIGIWFINPSVEYLSGGPTKVELSAHRDATFGTNTEAPAPPCLLNYWRSSHYGGSELHIGQGEEWSKVIGPFLIYCNSGKNPDEMWKDALAQGVRESDTWPYDWVKGVDYPGTKERGSVTGKLSLVDPGAPVPAGAFTNLLVGLTAQTNAGTEWQKDAKHYQFWVRGTASGTFTIPHIRPGEYSLHAITDGVLGEFTGPDVTVKTGKPLDLGTLEWRPVRHGKQLWEIGIPNRSGSEFFKGDVYAHWGWYLKYPQLFPDDVNYTVGSSDYRKDWFFEQLPHNEDSGNTTGKGNGRSTTWTINFTLAEAPVGKATLRVALCGIGAKSIDIRLNGKQVGTIAGLQYNATINRDGIAGSWSEEDISFDASTMISGKNILTLTIPAGGLTSGIIYDYLRLELDHDSPQLEKP